MKRRGLARILVGLVLVAGSFVGAFAYDPPPEPVTFICTPAKPRCIAMMAEAGR